VLYVFSQEIIMAGLIDCFVQRCTSMVRIPLACLRGTWTLMRTPSPPLVLSPELVLSIGASVLDRPHHKRRDWRPTIAVSGADEIEATTSWHLACPDYRRGAQCGEREKLQECFAERQGRTPRACWMARTGVSKLLRQEKRGVASEKVRQPRRCKPCLAG